MKCNTCGYEQSGESGFCEICGAVLSAEAPQQFGYNTPPAQQNVAPPVSGQGYNPQPQQGGQQPYGAPAPQYGNPPPPPPPQYGPPPQYNAGYGQQKSSSATAALVFGILSLVCGGTIWAILAIIFGIKGKKECTERGLPTGTATAGLVLGIIGGIFSIIMIIYYVLVVIPQVNDLMTYAIHIVSSIRG